MRVKLNTGGLIDQDNGRGMGVYAQEIVRRLPDRVQVVDSGQDLTHYLAFKIFSPVKLMAPAVVTIHDLIPLKYPAAYPPGIRGKFKWWLNRHQLKQAAAIITDSIASKQDIITLTGVEAKKIAVVYLAARELFRPLRPTQPFNLPKKFVLYVGGFNWNKNVVALVKSCLKFNYPLVVVGRQGLAIDYDIDHPENQELVRFQRLAKLNQKKIIRLGSLPDQALAEIYNLATVYVQPSRDEGFGLPVLEAMACGCPVLSSNNGSLPEITGASAGEFSPANLRQVWSNPALRQKLSQLGMIQAKKFSWNKTVKETVKVYETVIAGRA